MKRFLAVTLAALMLFAVLPAGAKVGERGVSARTLIDTDGSDGYTGDYVMIYNPSAKADDAKSTGNMAGLIETEVEPYHWKGKAESGLRAPMTDVDAALAREAAKRGADKPEPRGVSAEAMSFEVGDTHTFYISWYSPLQNHNVEFKVLAKGEHCYVWTPTSDDPNVWALDDMDPGYAQQAADVFDSKFDLMLYSFGEHYNGMNGDGRLNLLFYNIDDGWTPEENLPYIGGYFYAYDYYYSEMPILNIDTYPTIHYIYPDGQVLEDISMIYNCMVHEYQHLINYSQCGYTDSWVNEMMSAAAEEICFPGSSVVGRLLSWTNYYEMGGYDLLNPPNEVEYVPEYPLENGYSLYNWDDSQIDVLVLYAQVSLFAQYLFTHYGNGYFHALMDELADGWPTTAALENASETDASLLAEGFRVSLIANTTQDEFGGSYGFIPQEGYDPNEYYGIRNPYDLLCPVVFTGSSCTVYGGGAICVKPVGGVYYPPTGASPGLKYCGITRNAGDAPEAPLSGDADMNGVVNALDALLVLRASLGLAELTDLQLTAADIDANGSVNALDALEIMRLSLGLR